MKYYVEIWINTDLTIQDLQTLREAWSETIKKLEKACQTLHTRNSFFLAGKYSEWWQQKKLNSTLAFHHYTCWWYVLVSYDHVLISLTTGVAHLVRVTKTNKGTFTTQWFFSCPSMNKTYQTGFAYYSLLGSSTPGLLFFYFLNLKYSTLAS